MAIHPRVVPDHVHAGENDAGDATGATIPTSHAASHASGSTDPITPASIGAADTDHSADHETGGADALAHLAATVIDSGTLDGDRLPAMSAGKAGAVPATGAPANHYLRDDGFAHPAQDEIDGLETTATPRFAGLGIGTAGASNEARLVEGARVGIVGGPALAFRGAAKKLELTGGSLIVGDSPWTPGVGGAWAQSYDTGKAYVASACVFGDDLFVALKWGSYGRIYRLHGGTWAQVYDASTHGSSGIQSLRVHNGKLFAGGLGGLVYATSDGTTWAQAGDVGGGANIVCDLYSWGGLLWASTSMDNGKVYYSNNDGANWTASLTPSPASYYTTVFASFGGYLYVAASQNGGNPLGTGWVYRYNGSTWAKVATLSANQYFTSALVWGGKLWLGSVEGKVYSSSDGVAFTLAYDFGDGTVYGLCEFQGRLVATCSSAIYQSADGATWAAMAGIPSDNFYALAVYDGALYVTGTKKVYVYADTTEVSADGIITFGHMEFGGGLKPGGNIGVKGQLLQSGGVSGTDTWLPTGADKTYLAGAADGVPVYQQIPSTDIAMSATDKLLGRATAGAGDAEEIACTAAGRALLDDATVADQAHTLGLGTADSPAHVTVKLSGLNDGYLPYHQSDAAGLANSGVVWDNANSRLGIGTATPVKKLDTLVTTDNDGIQISFDTPPNGTNGSELIFASRTNSAPIVEMASIKAICIDGSVNYSGVLTFNTTNTATPAERMRITNAGNVGIGTTTPGHPLHVNAGNDYVRFDSSADTGTGARGLIIVNPTTGDYLNIWNYGADLMAIQSADASGYRSLTINPNGGNVGIGTTTPESKLSINGGLHVGGDSDAGDNNILVDGTIKSVGAFGCNNATPQTAYASGGAVTTAAGTYGFASDAQRDSLTTLVANIRAALVANGIMS